MAISERKILKLIKKGFTVQDWEHFPIEVQQNELIVSELVNKLANVSIERISSLCEEYPFIIKKLPIEQQLELVNDETFCHLSEDLQLEVINQNEQKIKYASEEIQLRYATQNPFKLSYLNPEYQKKLVDSNEFFLEFASKEIQVEYAKKDERLLCRCSNLVQCAFVKNDPNYYSKCSQDVKRSIVKLSNLSLEEVSIDTLEHYMSVNYDKLSLNELKEYSDNMMLATREDKMQIVEYLNYLIINMEKKKM